MFIALGSSRRRNLFCGTAVGVLLTIGAAERVYATCTPAAPTGAADITSCSGAFGVVNFSGGDDNVTFVSSATATDVLGGPGSDIFTIADASMPTISKATRPTTP